MTTEQQAPTAESPLVVRNRRGIAWAVLGLAGAAVTILLASRLRYVPMWDGRVYADCIVSAALKQFSLGALRCGGHASQAYLAYMTVVQRIAPTSFAPMLVANAFLLLLAAIGFARILAIAFPGEELAVDRALLTGAFSLQPATLAAVVQPGLDLPLVPEMLWCTVFLLQRRLVPAIVVGLAMAFTKETGLLLYGVLVACYGLWFVFRRGSWVDRARALAGSVPLAIPPLVFGAYLLYRLRQPATGEPVIWNATTTGEGFLHQFLVPRLDLYLINYIVMALFINFAWVASAFIAADVFVGTVHRAHRLPRRPLDGADRETIGFLALVTVAIGYAITRFATFGNSRYLIPLIALLLFPFMTALLRLRVPPSVRRSVLASWAVALLVSGVRTIDPVARRLYGTFPVGSNRMLHMTRITGECCGLGRDQLVYSLEFTSLDELTQRALATLPRIDSATLVVPDSTNWATIGALDPRTHRRTLRESGAITPKVVEPRDVVGATGRPSHLYYFALPYASASRGLREMMAYYDVDTERRYQSSGYVVPVYSLVLRTPTPRDSSRFAVTNGRRTNVGDPH